MVERPSWARFAALASSPVTVAVRGAVCTLETGPQAVEYVTFAPPDNWRIEDREHRLRYLANEVGHFQYPAGGGPVACFQPRRTGWWHSGGMESPALIVPRNLTEPADDDFTRPTGPVEAITYLGRSAWRVTLAPPARKPQALVQVLDVASGVTLALESTTGACLIAFVDIETGVDPPDGTFRPPQ